MKSKYDPAQPITSWFKKLEDGMEFADAGNVPFTTEQIVNMAYVLIYQTGAYKDDCKDWTRKPAAQKTWANFKTFFTTCYRKRRELLRLEQQGAVESHFGNNTTSSLSSPTNLAPSSEFTTAITSASDEVSSFSSFQKETNDSLQALANATIETNNHVLNLATENSSLRQQVVEMEALLRTMNNTILGRASYSTPLTPRPPTPPTNNANTTNTNNITRQRSDNNRGRDNARGRGGNQSQFDINSRHYCHTHGLSRTPTHTSANCRFPGENHKRNATFTNRLGGSNDRCELAINQNMDN